LVEIDRSWSGLDPTRLAVDQRSEFEALFAKLTAMAREQGDRMLQIERWCAEARTALDRLQSSCTECAGGTLDRDHLDAARAPVLALLDTAPMDEGVAAMQDRMRSALHSSRQLGEHLEVLDELLQGASGSAPTATVPPIDTGHGQGPQASDPAQRWQALAPLADPAHADALNRRFTQWREARDEAQRLQKAQRRERSTQRAQDHEERQSQALGVALANAEAALASGQLGDTHSHLMQMDALLHAGAVDADLRGRIDWVQAEYARLKGWQQWGGGLARDELVAQAEALAASIQDGNGLKGPGGPTRQLAEDIGQLRGRWKELDRLGGASSRSLWQRFDAALATAYQPVAAHLEAQRAVRQENLQLRNRLIEELNAVATLEAGEVQPVPQWKSQIAALDRFQTEWRKLGPVEHTVPHAEREPLLERMRQAVERLDKPLVEARRVAQLEREQLVARAQALAADASAGTLGRDGGAKVRELQAEWQRHAASLPLTRPIERALWTQFKAHIDALFDARDAALTARHAELAAFGAQRLLLIQRLQTASIDTSPSELKRLLSEVDDQWQRVGPAPRQDAAHLESQYRLAHEAARELLATSARRAWDTTCDTLTSKLAICDEWERAGGDAGVRSELQARWSALPALAHVWESALSTRFSAAAPSQRSHPTAAQSVDDMLLQLEVALELESPPAWHAARRALKLQALKAALEGRQSAAPSSVQEQLALVFAQAGLDASQHGRLSDILAHVRTRGPLKPG